MRLDSLFTIGLIVCTFVFKGTHYVSMYLLIICFDRHCVFFIDWSHGLESWIGVLDWSFGTEQKI